MKSLVVKYNEKKQPPPTLFIVSVIIPFNKQ